MYNNKVGNSIKYTLMRIIINYIKIINMYFICMVLLLLCNTIRGSRIKLFFPVA